MSNSGYGIITRSTAGGGGGGTVTNVKITAPDFTGNDYTNGLLSGLTPDVDFLLYSDEGSGVLLKENDGYTFAGSTITTTPGDYRLQIVS